MFQSRTTTNAIGKINEGLLETYENKFYHRSKKRDLREPHYIGEDRDAVEP